MNPAIPNALSAPPFKIPDPPEEFGHDGGKFYRAYDALADEIDEDMAKSLKEQLDGMLIFAGLFAGVNSAFLALTLPLLSPDPSGDTNALLAQNNAILMQLAMRANDTVAFNFTLPSAKFSPSGDIFAINTLFSLSLAFAIISSFLAVLGRQWLVYYRRRSGGGPDRQRWEQLKRFLGAQRWRLGLILDDILPSLLQAGLIIFCIAFIFYLRHLNPQISVLIGIPVYLGFAIFIGSALCTLWDTFCPFQSPLSHLLHWSVKKAPSALRIVLGFTKSSFGSLHKYVLQFVTQQVQTIRRSSSMSGETDSSWTNYHTEEMPRRRIFADIASIRRCLRFLARCREEETLESLQVIAIQRAICTSDDPATLLYAIGNILGIGNVAQMEQLWRDPIFQERFFDQFRDSYTRMLQIRGRDQVDVASSARRLYCAAACPQSARSRCRLETTVLIPYEELSDSPTVLLRSTLVFTILQFYTYYPADHTIKEFCGYLALYSNTLERGDWRLFCIISCIVSNLRIIRYIASSSIGSLRDAYRGDVDNTLRTLKKAFEVLVGPESREFADCDAILTNMLHCLNQIVAADPAQSIISMEHKFALFSCCEPVLRSPRPPLAVHKILRRLQMALAQAWQQEYTVWAGSRDIPASVLDVLVQHLVKLQTIYGAHLAYHEYVECLQAFHPPIQRLFSFEPDVWLHPIQACRKRNSLRNIFNELLLDVDIVSRQIQDGTRKPRDPDGRWCHWEEESTSMRATYSITFDPPESGWYQYEVFLRLLSPSPGTIKEGLDYTLSYSDLESLSFEV